MYFSLWGGVLFYIIKSSEISSDILKKPDILVEENCEYLFEGCQNSAELYLKIVTNEYYLDYIETLPPLKASEVKFVEMLLEKPSTLETFSQAEVIVKVILNLQC